MKLIGSYVNGNCSVEVYDNGTRIRKWEGETPKPEFPETIELKITDYCDRMCGYCFEDSTPVGKPADLFNLKFLETLHPYTEVDVIGGNPLSHPDLIPFLTLLRDKDIIVKLTVNQYHFYYAQDELKKICDQKLIQELGVSVPVTDSLKSRRLFDALHTFPFPNVVVKCINGVTDVLDLFNIAHQGYRFRLQILGYEGGKKRSIIYHSENFDRMWRNREMLKNGLPDIIKGKWFSEISFDYKAYKMLDAEKLLQNNELSKYVTIDDGTFMMYIDAVKKEYAQFAASAFRKPIKDDISQMYAEFVV